MSKAGKKRKTALDSRRLLIVLIIYGLPGVGKTYTERVLVNVFGYHYWDGHNAFPQEMIDCIAQEKQMILEIVNALTANLIKNIRILKKVVGDKPGDKPIFVHLQSEAQYVLARL